MYTFAGVHRHTGVCTFAGVHGVEGHPKDGGHDRDDRVQDQDEEGHEGGGGEVVTIAGVGTCLLLTRRKNTLFIVSDILERLTSWPARYCRVQCTLHTVHCTGGEVYREVHCTVRKSVQ